MINPTCAAAAKMIYQHFRTAACQDGCALAHGFERYDAKALVRGRRQIDTRTSHQAELFFSRHETPELDIRMWWNFKIGAARYYQAQFRARGAFVFEIKLEHL